MHHSGSGSKVSNGSDTGQLKVWSVECLCNETTCTVVCLRTFTHFGCCVAGSSLMRAHKPRAAILLSVLRAGRGKACETMAGRWHFCHTFAASSQLQGVRVRTLWCVSAAWQTRRLGMRQ